MRAASVLTSEFTIQAHKEASPLFSIGLSAAIALLFDVSAYRMIFAHPLQDQCWLLYAAGRILQGTQLYGSKLIETNPPLVVWFSALPMFLAAKLHTSPILLLQVVASY